jgi:hypothetical protein
MNINYISTLYTKPIFTAELTTAGNQKVNASAKFKVYSNSNGRKLLLGVTAWGKNAEEINNSLNIGDTIDMVGSFCSYRGKVKVKKGVYIMLTEDKPLLINKIGFILAKYKLIKTSTKTRRTKND